MSGSMLRFAAHPVHAYSTGLPCSTNWFSLFPPQNSLFDQTNSLFRGVGNSKLKPHDISGLGGFDSAYSRPNPRCHPRNRRRCPHPTPLEVRLRPVAAHRAAPRPSTRRTSGFVTSSAGGVPCPSCCLPSRGSTPAGRAGPRRSARTGRAGSPQARVFPASRARVSR